jgi:hypothetical protein
MPLLKLVISVWLARLWPCCQRTAVLVAAAAAAAGCAQFGDSSIQPVRPAAPSGNIEVMVTNRTNATAPLSVRIDGRVIFSGVLAPGERRLAAGAAGGGGWHKLVSQTGDRPPHFAMIRSDRRKWVTVKVDPARREGVGVHVSEKGWN